MFTLMLFLILCFRWFFYIPAIFYIRFRFWYRNIICLPTSTFDCCISIGMPWPGALEIVTNDVSGKLEQCWIFEDPLHVILSDYSEINISRFEQCAKSYQTSSKIGFSIRSGSSDNTAVIKLDIFCRFCNHLAFWIQSTLEDGQDWFEKFSGLLLCHLLVQRVPPSMCGSNSLLFYKAIFTTV